MTVPHLTHPSLPVPHGFFGREGGVSEGIYATLNAGRNSKDDPAHVLENRERIRKTLGADHLVSLSQIHSDIVHIINAPPTEPLQGDGFVTATPGLAISALSADCGPVLFVDAKAGIIAACHAGWRGAVGGIIESTVAATCELGASPSDTTAVLGPTISQLNYEVGEAWKAERLDEGMDARFFADGPSGTPHFDLPAFILSRLEACGVFGAWTGDCTYAEPERYHSYRRNTHSGETRYGRNISAIMLSPSLAAPMPRR